MIPQAFAEDSLGDAVQVTNLSFWQKIANLNSSLYVCVIWGIMI